MTSALRGTPRRGLAVILALYLVLAGIYSVVTPIFEASDELWHYPFVKRLADGEGLPILQGDRGEPWRQEGGQPPLYYALGALLTRGIDTSDLPEVRWRNPHADIGLIKPDGNANMVVHTERERWPYRGTVLALHLVRWLSALMGGVTVVAAYLLGREVAPEDPLIAWGTAAFTAFNAMFLFITSSVNNDALVNMLCALALWLIVRSVAVRPRPAQWVLLGIVLGLAALSKLSGLAMLPVAAAAVLVSAWRQPPEHRALVRDILVGGALLGGPVLLIGGWWFARNWTLYGDPTGLTAFLDVVGRRYPEPTLRQLAGEWRGLVMSFWGFFGAMNVAAPDGLYNGLTGLALVGLAGLPVALWRAQRSNRLGAERGYAGRGYAEQGWKLGLVAGWLAILSISFVRWTLSTPATQGRLLFTGLTGINLLLTVGLTGWAPRRYRAVLPGILGVVLLISAAALPFTTIAPAYRRPDTAAIVPQGAERLDRVFADVQGTPQMVLLGYRIEAKGSLEHAAPGDPLAVTLYWQAEAAMAQNYSVFVHLISGDERVLSQRDVYPGLGRYPTSLWQPGERIADTYVLSIPPTTMTPAELMLEVGLYRLETGERLRVLGDNGQASADNIRLGRIVLPSRRVGDIPNPVYVELDGRIALIGYDLDRTAAAPGEAFHLTLYWRALRDGEANYSVFTQVLGSQDRIWAQMDGWPLGGDAPTSTWRANQLIVDPYTLVVKEDAPPGVYDLQVGMYTADGARLNVIGEGGHAKDTRILLGSVRILEGR